MSSETQQRIRGEAIVELETQVYCACCEQWKFWGCTKCGLVFATLQNALKHKCVECWAQGTA